MKIIDWDNIDNNNSIGNIFIVTECESNSMHEKNSSKFNLIRKGSTFDSFWNFFFFL